MRSTVARVVEESCASPRSLARESGCPMESLAKARTSGAALSLALGPGSPSTPPDQVRGALQASGKRRLGDQAQLSPLLSRAHAAKAECDPGPSARSRREAAPNSFREERGSRPPLPPGSAQPPQPRKRLEQPVGRGLDPAAEEADAGQDEKRAHCLLDIGEARAH